MKNTILIVVAILLVGGSFVFAEYHNDKAKIEYTAPVTVVKSESEFAEVDTDNDGEKDWEEILVGSDPKDPKSKGAKVKAGVTADITKPAVKLEPIDLVSRDFFARYMELRQMGVSSDKASQSELVAKTVGNISIGAPEDYVMSEIVIGTGSGAEVVKVYGGEVGNIFKTYGIKSRNEAVITKESLEKENPEILKEIDPIIKSYKNIINALIKVRAPQEVALIHLDIINAMNTALFSAQSLRDSGIDPTRGIQGLAYYQVAERSLTNALNAIKSYFTYLGINENIF